jgi:hypothetical protein
MMPQKSPWEEKRFVFVPKDADEDVRAEGVPQNAWRGDTDKELYVVLDDRALIKLILKPNGWKAAYVRMPVDDPLIDPTWSSRVPQPVPKEAEQAITTARQTLKTFATHYAAAADE